MSMSYGQKGRMTGRLSLPVSRRGRESLKGQDLIVTLDGHSSNSAGEGKENRVIEQDLLETLKIFERYRRILELTSKLKTGKTASKKKTSRYVFTLDMFTKNNVEAMNQVTHLILSTIHPKDSQTRFQLCWPAEDRKAESEYRKIAFKWIDEISKCFPYFFELIKPQFNFFVTPAGERVVRFLMALANCGLMILAQRIQAKNGKTLLTMADEARTETTGKMNVAVSRNYEYCLRKLKNRAKTLIHQRELSRKQAAEEAKAAKNRKALDEKVKELIRKRAEIFPKNSDGLIRSTLRFVMADGRKYETGDLRSVAQTGCEDILGTELRRVWSEKLSNLCGRYAKFQSFLKKQQPFMTALEVVDANYNVVIDAKYFPDLFKSDGNSPPDFMECISQSILRLDDLRNLFPNNLFRAVDFEKQDQLMEKIENCLTAGSDVLASFSPPITKEELLFYLKLDEMALGGTDWKKLVPLAAQSQYGDFDLERALKITPVKFRDFENSSGLTPKFTCEITSSTRLTPEEHKIGRLNESIRISLAKN